MAEILSRISSKRPTIHLSSLSVYLKVINLALCLLVINISMVQTAICPKSVPSSASKTTEQSTFSGSTSTYVFAVIGDPVSNSLYYLYGITITIVKTVLQKVDASASQTWLASFAFQSNTMSLSLDEAKQNVYLASSTSSLTVLKLSASNGAIVSQQLL